MSDIHIVQGDLEALSASVGSVATNVAGVDINGALDAISTCMQGSNGPSKAVSAGQTMHSSVARIQSSYQDLSEDVLTAARQFRVSDSRAAQWLQAAGVLEPGDPWY